MVESSLIYSGNACSSYAQKELAYLSAGMRRSAIPARPIARGLGALPKETGGVQGERRVINMRSKKHVCVNDLAWWQRLARTLGGSSTW